jgi:hypothetical protein
MLSPLSPLSTGESLWRESIGPCTVLLQPEDGSFPETGENRSRLWPKRKRHSFGNADQAEGRALGGRSARQRLSGQCRPHFPPWVQRNPSLRAKEPRKGVRAEFASFRARWEPGGVRSGGNLKEAGREVRFNACFSGTRRSSLRREPGRVSSKFASMERPGNLEEASASAREPEREPTGAERPRPEPRSRQLTALTGHCADRGQWGLAAMPAPIRVWAYAAMRPR